MIFAVDSAECDVGVKALYNALFAK
jgi:hypothetical protein